MDRRDFMQYFKAVGSMAVVSSLPRYVGAPKLAGDVHRFGVNIPFSSFYNEESNHLLLGYFLATKHINKGGSLLGTRFFPNLKGNGILGKKVQLILKDSMGDAGIAKANAQDLFQSYGVVMVSGGTSSAEVLVNRAVASEHGFVCMDGISHSESCSKDQNGFSMNFDNKHSAEIVARQVAKGSRYIQIYAKYDWSKNQMAAFTEKLNQRGAIEVARYQMNDTMVSEAFQRLKESDAEALVINLYGQKLVKFMNTLMASPDLVQSLRKNKSQIVVPLISQLIEKSFDFSKVPGLVTCKFWDAEFPRDSVAKTFVREFEAEYGVKPSEASYISYFQTLNFANAAQGVGSFDRQPVANYLKSEAHERFQYSSDEHRAFDSGVLVVNQGAQDGLQKSLV